MSANKTAKDYTGAEFVITREFDAPREMVFKAWTDPKQLQQWWGPTGFTNPVCEWDVRPGGKIYDVMRAPNGAEYPMGGEFREIVPPEKLVFMCGPLDDTKNFIFEFLHTAVFTEQKGKTRLTLHSKVLKVTPAASQYIGGFETGMTLSLERLEDLLLPPGAPLVIERVFDAPIGLVWQALTEKERISQWSFDMKEFKPEPGFEFDFSAEKNGVKYIHLCKITEAVRNKKLAYTWRYKGQPGNSLVTFELFDEGAKTRLKLTHIGIETFPQNGDYDRKNFRMGWTHLLGFELKNFVENDTSDRDFVVARVVDAPREMVWNAMTDPKHVVNWWGPRGFTTTIESMDFRVGGEWKQVMHGPDGANYQNSHVFQEIVKPERIVMSHGGKKEGGSSVRFVATWTFEVVGENKTKVTIHMVFPSAAERDRVVREFGAIEGGKQTLERLGEFVATKQSAA
jgi:uncharacterized protein YndB with AHSA1/START domain